MPYPSPVTYPSPTLYPGFLGGGGGRKVAIGDIVFGSSEPAADGSWFSLTTFDGWRGATGTTAQLTQRTRGHGATSSEGFMPARYMTIGGLIHAPDAATLDAAIDRLNTAITLTETQMVVVDPGGVRNVMVKRAGEVLPELITETLASYSVLVSAKDPLKYGDLVTASTALPSESGGVVYPVTYPLTYTGVSVSGVLRVNNPGNTQAPVWLRVDGPVPAGGWTVTHINKGKSLTFSTALALDAGEFVTVDMGKREVLAQGQAARAGYVTSRGWFSLDPGDNDIAFTAQNYSSTALLTVSTMPAWT